MRQVITFILLVAALAGVGATASVHAAEAADARPALRFTSLRAATVPRGPVLVTNVPIERTGGPVSLALRPLPILSAESAFVRGQRRGPDVPLSGFAPEEIALLSGHVVDRPDDSTAFIACWGERISGYLELAGERYALSAQGAIQANSPAVHGRGAALAHAIDDMVPLPADTPRGATRSSAAPEDADVYLVELAVDTDHEFFARFDDAEDAAFYVAALYGAIGHIYLRDLGIHLHLTYVRLWETPNDPYDAADPFLPFISTWQSTMAHVPRDAAQLLTGRQDVPFSGKAYIDGLCTSRGYSVVGAVRGWVHALGADLLGPSDLRLAAHELAHVCGAGHTHSYGVDACIPTPGVEQRGTIMSYCSIHNGGDANIDERFHAVVRTAVRNFVSTAPCATLDCNLNAVPDFDDLSSGASLDANANSVPDECEDCNGNGVLDPADIAGGAADVNANGIPDECEPDCNANGVPDAHDLVLGADDDNGNRVPDACEPDLNSNGQADYLDIQSDMSLDVNRNARLDAYEDCNGDGITDAAELASAHHIWVVSDLQSVARQFHGGTGVRTRTTSGVELSSPHGVVITPDAHLLVADSGNARIARFDARTGDYLGDLVAPGASDLTYPTAMALTPAGTLLVADRDNDAVVEYSLADGSLLRVLVSGGAGLLAAPYGLAFTPDGSHLLVCSAGTGEVLAYAWPTGAFAGVFAATDDLHEPRDLSFKSDGHLLVASYGTGVVLEFDGYTGQYLGMFNAPLYGQEADLAAWALAVTVTGDVLVGSHDVEGGNSVLTLDPVTGLFRTDLVSGPYSGLGPITGLAVVPADGVDCNVNFYPDDCDVAADFNVDEDGNGTPDACEVDCNANGVFDLQELAPHGPYIDCDVNGVLDACDIASGAAHDCNSNGRIDGCEVFFDCNSNGIPDECELAEDDCNDNGVLDACELAAAHDCCTSNHGVGCADAQVMACVCAFDPYCCDVYWDRTCAQHVIDRVCGFCPAGDCDGNATPDACDPDCDSNGLVDACEITAGSAEDCDSNGVPDPCDIAADPGADCDSNAILDACEPDFDQDGVIDACDGDIDDDGVSNIDDPCDHSPADAPLNPTGGPMGDIDDDCIVTLDDFWFFTICTDISGPGSVPAFGECIDVFDFDHDQDVDLRDYQGFQQASIGLPDTQ